MFSNFRFYKLLFSSVLTFAIPSLAIAENATWDILQLRPEFTLRLSENKQSRRDESDFDRTESKMSSRKNLDHWEQFVFPMSKENAIALGLRQLVFRSAHCTGRAFVSDHTRSIEISGKHKFLLLRGTGNSEQNLRISRFDLVLLEKEYIHLQIICDGLFQEGGQLVIDELGFDWQIVERHDPKWLEALYEEHLALKAKTSSEKKTVSEAKAKPSWTKSAYDRIRNSLRSHPTPQKPEQKP